MGLSRVSLAFFSVACLCGLAGMIAGVVMGIRQDFSLAPAHAHLNLLGWATLALMGTFHAVARSRGPAAWVNFGLSALGGVLMPLSLGFYLAGHKAFTSGMQVGALAAVCGMLTFVGLVLTAWSRSAPG